MGSELAQSYDCARRVWIAALPSILESIVCTNECFLQLLFQKPRELNNNRS